MEAGGVVSVDPANQAVDKTVVRAGIGSFVTRMGLLDNIFPGSNSPFQPFITVNNVSVDNPGASLTSGTSAPLTITTLNPNQFQTGTPCGVGTNNDFAGVVEFGSFGCGSAGQFWALNGPVSIKSGAFAGPNGIANSVKYFTVNAAAPPTGTFNLQPGVRDAIYRPGFQGLEPIDVLDIRAERAERIPVPRRGVRLPESSEFGPEQFGIQSDVESARRTHEQDQSSENIAAFLAILLSGARVREGRKTRFAVPGNHLIRLRVPGTVGVAQLGRAPDCGSGGRGFESLRPPHTEYYNL